MCSTEEGAERRKRGEEERQTEADRGSEGRGNRGSKQPDPALHSSFPPPFVSFHPSFIPPSFLLSFLLYISHFCSNQIVCYVMVRRAAGASNTCAGRRRDTTGFTTGFTTRSSYGFRRGLGGVHDGQRISRVAPQPLHGAISGGDLCLVLGIGEVATQYWRTPTGSTPGSTTRSTTGWRF